MPRVAVKRGLVGVTGKRPTHLLEDIFLPAIFQIGKDNGMAFLQMPKAS